MLLNTLLVDFREVLLITFVNRHGLTAGLSRPLLK